MAKNKRGKARAAAGARADAAAPLGESAAGSRVRSGAFCFRSSKGAPFLVVSDRQLVDGIPAPSPQELEELLALCASMVQQWTTRGAVILADFEGEFTGIEGELVTAAFQRTLSLDPKSLRPMLAGGISLDTGLLVDLRCGAGAGLTQRVMESEAITKVIWGADGDLASLLHTPSARPLGIRSASVADAQLAFSAAERRLSMVKMLERVTGKSLAGLPEKGSIDFDSAHAANRRALPLPLCKQVAAYAADDLHRLEAVLLTQKPADGTYARTRMQTSSLVARLSKDPSSFSAEKLGRYQEWLRQRTGAKLLALAVRAKRHLLALRLLGGLPDGGSAEFQAVEAEVDEVLATGGVQVPSDLSFSSGPPQAPAAAPTAAEPPTAAERGAAAGPGTAAELGAATEGAAAEQPAAAAGQGARRAGGKRRPCRARGQAARRKRPAPGAAAAPPAAADEVPAAAAAEQGAPSADDGAGAAAARGRARPAKRRRVGSARRARA